MNRSRERAKMLITVTISDVVVRVAGARGMAVIEFVESLIDQGMLTVDKPKETPVLSSAMERIRALRNAGK
jgi:hypothetical protein